MTLSLVLQALAPQLTLAAMGVLVLVLDRLLTQADKRRWLPRLAVGGLIGALVATCLAWGDPTTAPVPLEIDRFALIVASLSLVALGLAIPLVTLYVRGHHHRQGAFYALLLLAGLALSLVGATLDLAVLLLALALLDLATGLLISIPREAPAEVEIASRTVRYLTILSAISLFGLSWLIGLGGSTNLAVLGERLTADGAPARGLLIPALTLTVVGMTGRLAIFPFHRWLADTLADAPTPVGVCFAVAQPIAGAAALARILLTALPAGAPSADWRTMLTALAGLTMVAGGLVALWETDAKRFLAFLGIAQSGALLIGPATATTGGLPAMWLTLLSHVLALTGALTALHAWQAQTGSRSLADCAGMHRRAPELAWPLLVCLLSLVGLPPTAGFVGRLALYDAAIKDGLYWLAIVGGIGSVVGLAAVWRPIQAAFVAPAPRGRRLTLRHLTLAAIGLTGAGVLVAALYAGALLDFLAV